MKHGCIVGLLFGFLTSDAPAQEKAKDDPKSRPITTTKGKVGDLLRQWWKDGTAAGNIGDFYDNRDGGHSDLDTSPYPQLDRIVYRPDEIKAKLHWAAARGVRPGVVFGNSSTSAPAHQSGSNPRSYYCSPTGVELLYKQYRGNNLYIYPEHRDHDPGKNGPDDGFGDLYPTNTPYLIISQGSSGSDQPFMRAVPFTLAAFRPEVKAKLAEDGLLMPIVQMILRATSKALKDPKQYLKGKAHPTVFEGGNVDDLAMIQMAHEITLDTLPPLVQLEAVKEAKAARGRDFFEPDVDPASASERLADTPSVIARVWRGKEGERTMVVSAEKSFDANKKPLEFHWVILRGDPKRISIKPQNKESSVAEITVKHHERLPIAPGSSMESNRIDIGVFVHNGHFFSAPAFITFFSLDSEARAYDEKGRILEIGYGMAETRLEVNNWLSLLRMAMKEEGGRSELLGLKKTDELTELFIKYERAVHHQLPLQTAIRMTEIRRGQRDRERGELEKHIEATQGKLVKEQAVELLNQLAKMKAELKEIDRILKEQREGLVRINEKMTDLIDTPIKGSKQSLREQVNQALAKHADDPRFAITHRALIGEAPKDKEPAQKLRTERQRLIGLGLAEETEQGLSFKTLRGEKSLTDYERAQIRRFNGLLLAEALYPSFLQARLLPHLVDHRLSVPRDWRELHHYDERARYRGFSRWNGHGVSHFHVDGRMILEKDKLGRPRTAQEIHYDLKGKRFGPSGSVMLEMRPSAVFVYSYESDEDVIGVAKGQDGR